MQSQESKKITHKYESSWVGFADKDLGRTLPITVLLYNNVYYCVIYIVLYRNVYIVLYCSIRVNEENTVFSCTFEINFMQHSKLNTVVTYAD